jgi:hypothetical protein
LIPFVARTQLSRSSGEYFFSKLTPVDIVSGLIAILMTLTVIFTVFYQVTHQTTVDVPLVLSNGITTILGFYFGRATVGQNAA